MIKKKTLLPTILSIAFLAFAWQLIAWSVGYPSIFPSLPDLFAHIVKMFLGAEFYVAVLATVLRGLIGFIFAFTLALLMSLTASHSHFWKVFFQPILVALRSIPVISVVLLALLWFSPPHLPVFIALITMFPILYQSMLNGLENTDIKLVEMAKVFGKSTFQIITTIYLPSARNIIFGGISTAMGFGWRAIIIGEVLAQPLKGIGTSMKQAQALIDVSELIAWTVVAIAISYLFEFFIKKLGKTEFKLIQIKHISSDIHISDNKHIQLNNINKYFNQNLVLKNLTTQFDNQSVTCIKGASGVGKTTLLRLTAQLIKPDSGKLEFAKHLRYAYAFQDARLLPWLTVYENIAYTSKSEETTEKLLEALELDEHQNKYPYELSGGQQQRVSLARALAVASDVLLLDEPMSGLDDALKLKIQHLLSAHIQQYKPIVLWATHENIHLNNVHTKELNLQ